LLAPIFVRELLGCAGFSGETLASKKSAKVSAREIGCSIYRFQTGQKLKKARPARAGSATMIRIFGSQKPAYGKTK
jgi:hypothetical protein